MFQVLFFFMDYNLDLIASFHNFASKPVNVYFIDSLMLHLIFL